MWQSRGREYGLNMTSMILLKAPARIRTINGRLFLYLKDSTGGGRGNTVPSSFNTKAVIDKIIWTEQNLNAKRCYFCFGSSGSGPIWNMTLLLSMLWAATIKSPHTDLWKYQKICTESKKDTVKQKGDKANLIGKEKIWTKKETAIEILVRICKRPKCDRSTARVKPPENLLWVYIDRRLLGCMFIWYSFTFFKVHLTQIHYSLICPGGINSYSI